MSTPWKNFSLKELLCRCGRADCPSTLESIDVPTMDAIQDIRDRLSIPLSITSGHRCANHRSEIRKAKPGTHNQGKAVDIGIGSYGAHLVMQMALAKPYIELIEKFQQAISNCENLEQLEDEFYQLLDESGWTNGYLPPVFTGIGVSQESRKPRFIHLDTAENQDTPRPRVWSY